MAAAQAATRDVVMAPLDSSMFMSQFMKETKREKIDGQVGSCNDEEKVLVNAPNAAASSVNATVKNG